MATNSFSSAINTTTIAGYRLFWDEIRAALAAVGMVQTADSGQLNPATHVEPAVNQASSGYEIWRFNDALQATAPIFVKLEPGRGNASGQVMAWMQFGSGTNGAGTITGTASARRTLCDNNTPLAGGWPSYFCHAPGFLGVSHKQGAHTFGTGRGVASFMICRTCDAAGVPTASGAVGYWPQASGAPPTVQHLRFEATSAALGASVGNFALVPHAATSTSVGADKQVFLHLTITPQVAPVFGALSYLTGEYAAGTTFSVAMVGTTPRTYLTQGQSFGWGWNSNIPPAGIAMLWE